jgi:hypothetical protein
MSLKEALKECLGWSSPIGVGIFLWERESSSISEH